jgi:hypothetical protein
LQANQTHLVTIVVKDRYLLLLYLWDEIAIPYQFTNLIIVIARGKYKLLRPLTKNFFKLMLSVISKPILELIISVTKAEDFELYILAINYLSNVIEMSYVEIINSNSALPKLSY